jgi:tetratricopeptide (TPR) repeat protein
MLGRLVMLFAALASTAEADSIHLKNGRTIVADQVRDNGERVEYDVGENSYAIPKSLIDHIDTADSTKGLSSAPLASIEVEHPHLAGAQLNNLTAETRITPELLSSIEQSGNKLKLAYALLLLGVQEQQRGRTDEARAHIERATGLTPNDPEALATYVWILLESDRASVAQSYAEDVARRFPGSAIAHKMLGLAYYKNDRIQLAVEEFTRAKELSGSDAELDSYLKAATRQAKAESDFSTTASTHFSMRYEGQKASAQLREQILATLEHHFEDLVSTLNVLPRDSIVVVLYTNESYFDVTQAPSWTGAINDGKLRIPISGLTQVTPELSRVLKHELAHSFIAQATGGRCPVWLNEGIAQMVEPKSTAQFLPYLAQIFSTGNQMPLKSLEGSFTNYNSAQASTAYVESLAYVEYISRTYGMTRLTDLLRDVNEGQSPEEALKSVIHDDYAQLEYEYARHLPPVNPN